MRTYNVYAKPIQNNLGNEPVLIAMVGAMSKKSAVHKVRCLPDNRGLYRLDSFFAVVTKCKQ